MRRLSESELLGKSLSILTAVAIILIVDQVFGSMVSLLLSAPIGIISGYSIARIQGSLS